VLASDRILAKFPCPVKTCLPGWRRSEKSIRGRNEIPGPFGWIQILGTFEIDRLGQSDPTCKLRGGVLAHIDVHPNSITLLDHREPIGCPRLDRTSDRRRPVRSASTLKKQLGAANEQSRIPTQPPSELGDVIHAASNKATNQCFTFRLEPTHPPPLHTPSVRPSEHGDSEHNDMIRHRHRNEICSNLPKHGLATI